MKLVILFLISFNVMAVDRPYCKKLRFKGTQNFTHVKCSEVPSFPMVVPKGWGYTAGNYEIISEDKSAEISDRASRRVAAKAARIRLRSKDCSALATQFLRDICAVNKR